jgi:uncharacterized protein YfdQ (DUF2303 family)
VIDPETRTEVAAAHEAGLLSAGVKGRVTDIEGIPVALLPQGMYIEPLVDALRLADERAEKPRRHEGFSTHFDLESFIAHIEMFSVGDSVVWAHPNAAEIKAVYNYHTPDGPAWSDFGAKYSCPHSPEWCEWKKKDGAAMSQDAFADFIEEHFENLTVPRKNEEGPTPVDVLEMARNLQIHTKGQFRRTLDATTGEHTMVVKQEHGESSTKIPRRFFVALRVYDGGDEYRVEARVRFRLREGVPSFMFNLHRLQEIHRDAFNDVCSKISERTSRMVFIGMAER